MEERILDETKFDEKQYVVFKLGAEIFGLDINKVKEIIVHQDTTQIPGTREQIEGVINLRGQVIPIYDLRKKFGFPQEECSRSTRIIVVEVHDSTVGIIVDGVSEVLMISSKIIEKPSSIVTSEVDGNYITGIAKMEHHMVIILNLNKIINVSMVQAV